MGYGVDANWATVGGAKGGVVYDFYRDEVTQAYASVDAYVGTRVTLSADYDYYVPSYDGDSIFNFFAGEPMNDVGLRGNVNVNERLSVAGGGHVRIFDVQTGPFDPAKTPASYSPSPNYSAVETYYPTNGHPLDGGANVSARWLAGETTLGLRGAGDFGHEGDRAGADVTGERVFETRYVLSGRAGVWQWDDKIRPDRGATSFNYVAALGYIFAPRAQARFEWEHDINRLVGQRFRLMLWVTAAVTK